MEALTPCEANHLRLLRLGLSVREAAKVVYRSPLTVCNHRASIKRKITHEEWLEHEREGERARDARMLDHAYIAAA